MPRPAPSAVLPPRRRPRRACGLRPWLLGLGLLLPLLALAPAVLTAATVRPVRDDGVNLIQDDAHPYGSAASRQVMTELAGDGAKVVALVPFLWQPSPESPDIVRGEDMRDDQLRAGIRLARLAGLKVMVKPHIWVPERWAGAVVMTSDADWGAWFQRYRDAVVHLARIAAEEKAEFFSIGTEVAQSTERPEWAQVIAAVREVFPGQLTYSAHWAEEVERFPFWDRLDAVAVTLYPALGADDDPAAWRAGMVGEIDRVIAVANRVGRPVWITEIGLRSAEGAAAKPWESAEERVAVPDGDLQADVLAVWYEMLDRPEIAQILIWRWITDPAAGGATDTDFTVQNKPAQSLLTCLWRNRCSPAAPAFSQRLKAILAARPPAPAAGPPQAGPSPAPATPAAPPSGEASPAPPLATPEPAPGITRGPPAASPPAAAGGTPVAGQPPAGSPAATAAPSPGTAPPEVDARPAPAGMPPSTALPASPVSAGSPAAPAPAGAAPPAAVPATPPAPAAPAPATAVPASPAWPAPAVAAPPAAMPAGVSAPDSAAPAEPSVRPVPSSSPGPGAPAAGDPAGSTPAQPAPPAGPASGDSGGAGDSPAPGGRAAPVPAGAGG